MGRQRRLIFPYVCRKNKLGLSKPRVSGQKEIGERERESEKEGGKENLIHQRQGMKEKVGMVGGIHIKRKISKKSQKISKKPGEKLNERIVSSLWVDLLCNLFFCNSLLFFILIASLESKDLFMEEEKEKKEK